MTKRQTVGYRIAQKRREKAVRDGRDISQADVAAAVGVSGASVSEWEANKKVPRDATLDRLATYLDTTPAFLRYGLGDQRRHEMDLDLDPAQDQLITGAEIERARRAVVKKSARSKKGHQRGA